MLGNPDLPARERNVVVGRRERHERDVRLAAPPRLDDDDAPERDLVGRLASALEAERAAVDPIAHPGFTTRRAASPRSQRGCPWGALGHPTVAPYGSERDPQVISEVFRAPSVGFEPEGRGF